MTTHAEKDITKARRENPRAYTEDVFGLAIGCDGENEIFADAEVMFYYHRAEPSTWDYPGCPAEVEIVGVFDQETGKEIVMDDDYCDAVEAAVWEIVG